MTTTIDSGALPVARAAIAQMSVQEKAQLLGELPQAVAAAAAPPAADAATTDILDELDQLISDTAAAGPAALDSAALVSEMRR